MAQQTLLNVPDTRSSATGKKITSVACAGVKDVDLAVKAAEKAYRTSWGLKISGTERGKLIYKLADLMEKNWDELAAIESLDAGMYHALWRLRAADNATGKPFGNAKYMDVKMAIDNMRYFAGWADKGQGKTIEVCHVAAGSPPESDRISQTDEAKFAYTRHEPIGVCGCIVPWNFPRGYHSPLSSLSR